MTKFPVIAVIALSFSLTQLAGCDRKQEAPAPEVQASAGGAVATVAAPGSPTAPAAPATTEASASISADGVEARAGDVSVKLPN